MSSTQNESISLHLHEWRISSFSKKVRMALDHKGLRYRRTSVSLLSRAELKARTGLTKVPVLVDGDEWITDSTRILLHLDAKWPEPGIYPTDPRKRHECLALEDWADEALCRTAEPLAWLRPENRRHLIRELREELPGLTTAIVTRVFMPLMLRPFRDMVRLHGSFERTRQLFFEQLDIIEGLLDGRQYLFGDHPTAADFAIAAQLHTPLRLDVGDEIRRRSSLVAMIERTTSQLVAPLESAA